MQCCWYLPPLISLHWSAEQMSPQSSKCSCQQWGNHVITVIEKPVGRSCHVECFILIFYRLLPLDLKHSFSGGWINFSFGFLMAHDTHMYVYNMLVCYVYKINVDFLFPRLPRHPGYLAFRVALPPIGRSLPAHALTPFNPLLSLASGQVADLEHTPLLDTLPRQEREQKVKC